MQDNTFSGFTAVPSVGEPGFFFDFLGTKTRVSYLPEKDGWLSGKVFGFPAPGAVILYEFQEWQGVMDAIREARDSFVCFELGAGWGPWLVATTFALRQRGITDVQLVGVEAELPNIDKIRTHFTDNGIDYTRYKFIHAAIDGHDALPAPDHPGGARLLSLKSLLADAPIVDLIHCDIQFAESRAFTAGMDIMTDRVRRVVIGTHSRKIEDELIETFQKWPWRLEYETACRYTIIDGVPGLLADGVQVWRNTRLTPKA